MRFTAVRGLSVMRLGYWRTQLAESGPPRFVGVEVLSAVAPTERRIEIVFGDLTRPRLRGSRCRPSRSPVGGARATAS